MRYYFYSKQGVIFDISLYLTSHLRNGGAVFFIILAATKSAKYFNGVIFTVY